MSQPTSSRDCEPAQPAGTQTERPFPFDPVIEAYKPGIDRSLLIENLKLTPEERIMNLQALYDFGQELRRAMRAANSGP